MTDRDGVRTIDARHAAGQVRPRLALPGARLSTFRDSGPHAVQAFGTKLVVFADSAGSLHVLDAYCRHMGGDLSRGTVKGDAVACPFHDWRWGGDGRCAQIPYARRVPPAGPDPVLADAGAERAAVRLARPAGQPAAART